MSNPVRIKDIKVIPVLLCGGSGTRLWPLSRESLPKQFLKINSLNGNSFLQDTQERTKGINNILDPILICNSEHRFIAAEQMREINVEPNSIILEPIGKNTAPAMAIASLKALQIHEDPILLFLPTDHVIQNVKKFVEIVNYAINYAKKDLIVTFGVLPDKPEIGYGYIEAEKSLGNNDYNPQFIKRFIEKPSINTAKKLILDKKISWNSGIFLLKAKTLIDEIKKIKPEVLVASKVSISKSSYDLDFERLDKDSFDKCPNVSFDIAVMEKTNIGVVMPLDVGWSDAGNWDSFWKLTKKDTNNNAIFGKSHIKNSSNCLLHSENKLIVCMDMEDIVVVDTFDAILVAKRKSSQDIKDVVAKLKKQNYQEAKNHRRIYRPWGSYLSIADGPGWQVKRINVKSGCSLSLQKHKFRAEHWIVVSGTAEVQIRDEKKLLKKNQSTYIPLGFKHRLSNPGKDPLILIEVQSGSYLGEDDIIRFEDNYGREINE